MTPTIEQPALTVDACFNIDESVYVPDPNAGQRYIPSHLTLCSIFPDAKEHFMLHGGIRQRYALPAVPKGQFALLRVYDTYTLTRDLSYAAAAEPGDPNNGERQQNAPVSCHGVADDLVRAWALDAPGNASGARPGIGILNADEPTQAELDYLWEQQTTYFRWLVMVADDYWITGRREYITDDHRRALRWLGSEDRDWYKKIASIQFKQCPACGEQINVQALRCKHCSVELLKFYNGMGVKDSDITADLDYAIWAFLQKRKDIVEASNAKLRAEHGK